MTKLRRWGALLIPLAAVAVAGGTAFAANSAVIVTPANTQGWSTADTRPGGAVNFITDATSPAPPGALQLTTDATTTAKAQYLHADNTPLSQVNQLSYYTKQNSAAFPQGDPSYQLIVCLSGAPTATTCPGFTTFVFEPYENLPNNGNVAVLNNVWQKWDVAAGQFWSTRDVVCSGGPVVAGHGGPPFYTLTQIKSTCPSAVAAGFGVNIGSNNPSYNVESDLFNFNGTTYNFELTNVPTDKEQCKDGGFKNFTDANGQAFKNQGQCIAFVNSHSHGDGGGEDGGGDQHRGHGHGDGGGD